MALANPSDSSSDLPEEIVKLLEEPLCWEMEVSLFQCSYRPKGVIIFFQIGVGHEKTGGHTFLFHKKGVVTTIVKSYSRWLQILLSLLN